jgi:hypothetical protein
MAKKPKKSKKAPKCNCSQGQRVHGYVRACRKSRCAPKVATYKRSTDKKRSLGLKVKSRKRSKK